MAALRATVSACASSAPNRSRRSGVARSLSGCLPCFGRQQLLRGILHPSPQRFGTHLPSPGITRTRRDSCREADGGSGRSRLDQGNRAILIADRGTRWPGSLRSRRRSDCKGFHGAAIALHRFPFRRGWRSRGPIRRRTVRPWLTSGLLPFRGENRIWSRNLYGLRGKDRECRAW